MAGTNTSEETDAAKKKQDEEAAKKKQEEEATKKEKEKEATKPKSYTVKCKHCNQELEKVSTVEELKTVRAVHDMNCPALKEVEEKPAGTPKDKGHGINTEPETSMAKEIAQGILLGIAIGVLFYVGYKLFKSFKLWRANYLKRMKEVSEREKEKGK